MFVIALAVLVAMLAIPLISFIRGLRHESELKELRRRVELLERRMVPPVAAAPRTEAAPVAPPSAVDRSPLPPIPSPLTPSPALPPAPLPLPPTITHQAEGLEEQIGGRWLQHAGLLVLLLGIAFFLRYAFERDWLSPAVRVALGGVAGIGLVAGGLRLSQTYRTYGLLLSGGGLAALYLSVYGGLNLYYLFGPGLAFGLFVVITIAGAVLADRTDAQGLALFAVVGGYATPFLVGGDRDAQITLFSYVTLLVAATTYLSHRRTWPWLNVVSLLLTAFTVLSWAATFYTPDKYLRTELFLTVYCGMFLDALRKAWSPRREDAPLVFLLLLAPVGYHVWSVITLAPHGLAFLIYMIAFTLLAVLASVHNGSSLLRAIAWLAVALPMGGWIEQNHYRGWLVATLVAVAGIFAVHLVAQIRVVKADAAQEGDDLDEFDVALIHANGIGVFAALFEVLTDSATTPQLAMLAVALAAGNAGIWASLRRVSPIGALQWLGVAITLVAIAIWLQFGGPWAVVAWATEGAVVFWIATQSRRDWIRVGAWVLFGLAIYRWLQLDIQATTNVFQLIANARALTGIYLVAVIYVAAWLQCRQEDAAETRRVQERAIVLVVASVITLIVISMEIASFWDLRAEAADATVAREMMMSASWVIYAAVLVMIGMKYRYAPIRYFAIALFGFALLKVFVFDLQTLGGIYRVAGFLVIGLILLVVSFLYQRTRIQPEP